MGFIDDLKKAFGLNKSNLNNTFDNKTITINNNVDTEGGTSKYVVSSVDELKKMQDEVKKEKKDDIDSFLSNNTESSSTPSITKEPKKKYILPTINILDKPNIREDDSEEINKKKEKLQNTLQAFNIPAEVINIIIGPNITQYEIKLQSGTKVSKLLGIKNELKLALSKNDIDFIVPLPGKGTIGLEVQNDERYFVSLREVLKEIPKNESNNKLLIPLGKNKNGYCKFYSLDKMPHLLISGVSGSGKSNFIDDIICTYLMRTKPDEVKLVLIGSDKSCLANYNGVPHLLMPVVTNPLKASIALQRIVNEMDNRYDELSRKTVRNISGYNELICKENKTRNIECKINKMPTIVLIIDDYADLIKNAPLGLEDSLIRIGQMGRITGIHIVLSLSPNATLVSNSIKANIPSRISFEMASQSDSKSIIDIPGAEKLFSMGDMFFLARAEKNVERIQSPLITDKEIQRIIDYTVKQQIAQYDDKWTNLEAAADQGNAGHHAGDSSEDDDDDDLYNDVVEFVITSGKASASLLQRRFKIKYNRAARLVDLLEERGIIGPQNGSKPREVLVRIDDVSNEEE